MIHFDELSVAEEMERTQSFRNGYTKTDVFLYAKYLRYKKIVDAGMSYDDITVDEMTKMDNQIEKELIAFCERSCSYFNYTVKFNDIDMAVDSSRRFKLKLPLPTPITQSEWDAIMTIDNDNYRRMLFIMLVDAKYHRLHSVSIENPGELTEDTVFYCHMTKGEIFKAGKCKFESAEEKDFSLGCLYDAGLFDITNNKFCTWYVKFVDISRDNVIDYVTDYNHLNLYYDKFMGEKIGNCKICGRLFKQGKTKLSDYCYKHRGYHKKNIQELICIDCGIKFKVGAKSRESCRCKQCQKIQSKILATERKRKQRMRNKANINNVTESI